MLLSSKFTEISIVNYGIGNIGSLQSALKKIGFFPKLIESEKDFKASNNIIFPGVGAAKPAMSVVSQLIGENSYEVLLKKPRRVLGICLGLQILMDKSLEGGSTDCMGIFEGVVSPIPVEYESKIPRIGWFPIIRNPSQNKSLIESSFAIEADEFYFAHSYYVNLGNNSYCTYFTSKLNFPAIIEKDNVIGVQFHPEKSGRIGLNLLKQIFTYK